MVYIAPSILAADSSRLKEEVLNLEQNGADMIHFDVMDGHFVPNLTFGPKILKEIKQHTRLPFDVHLMVNDPQKFVEWYAAAGADMLTFHLEATSSPQEIIKLIKSYNIKAGLSLKPDTDVNLLRPYIPQIDLVLVMAVEPGFGGQTFRSDTVARIHKTREIIDDYPVWIEVDGGITPETAPLCIRAGTDILVAGTSVFKNGNYAENIRKLKGEKI